MSQKALDLVGTGQQEGVGFLYQVTESYSCQSGLCSVQSECVS